MSKCGKILKGIGGFYYVKTDIGVIECRARGLFRNKAQLPYVGDNVEIELNDDGTGYVTKIMERKNFFIRPPISNVDMLLIVLAVANPAPDLMFLDKMLIQSEVNGVEAVICFNKCDLEDNEEYIEYTDIYTKLGYRVFNTSTISGDGIEKLKSYIKGKVISVCGFSGVGKSSILNCLLPENVQKVGEVSKKLSRGKHTTREVSLIEYTEGSYLADTPGFSSLSLPDSIDKNTLKDFFGEFRSFEAECRFSDCLHINSRHCEICNAVGRGDISQLRYNNYIKLYETLKDKKEWK